jgi:hypothetical protein
LLSEPDQSDAIITRHRAADKDLQFNLPVSGPPDSRGLKEDSNPSSACPTRRRPRSRPRRGGLWGSLQS